MNAVQPILNFGLRRPASPALIEGARTITYGELAERIRQTASHLSAIGIKPGDRIGLCLNDSADHVIALLATGYLGAAGPAGLARDTGRDREFHRRTRSDDGTWWNPIPLRWTPRP